MCKRNKVFCLCVCLCVGHFATLISQKCQMHCESEQKQPPCRSKPLVKLCTKMCTIHIWLCTCVWAPRNMKAQKFFFYITQPSKKIKPSNTMLATLLLVYCLEWMLGYHNLKVWSCRQAKYQQQYSRQLFVYTKNSSRKCYLINLAWASVKLGCIFKCKRSSGMLK